MINLISKNCLLSSRRGALWQLLVNTYFIELSTKCVKRVTVVSCQIVHVARGDVLCTCLFMFCGKYNAMDYDSIIFPDVASYYNELLVSRYLPKTHQIKKNLKYLNNIVLPVRGRWEPQSNWSIIALMNYRKYHHS